MAKNRKDQSTRRGYEVGQNYYHSVINFLYKLIHIHYTFYTGVNISSQASDGLPQADRLRRLQTHRHRAGPGQGGTDGVAQLSVVQGRAVMTVI